MTHTSKLILGLLLTASAGFVDAVAFLQLGGFFASFMSGNTTQLGIGLAGQPGVTGQVAIWFPAVLILLFFIGAFLGVLVAGHHARRGGLMVLGGVLGLLLVVVALRHSYALFTAPVMLLSAAMGAQNAAVRPIGAARLGATYVTGTLFNAASDLALALRGNAPKWRWIQHFTVWLALMGGAIAGAFGDFMLGLYALLIPALVIAIVMVAEFFDQSAR